MLSHESDNMDAVLQITAGAGGTESCDWAQMLMRMYTMYCEKNNLKSSILNEQDGDTATADLITERITQHEKFVWMLTATISGAD